MSGISCPPGKSSWPELLGWNGELAAARIRQENPLVNQATVVRVRDHFVIHNFRCDRVWVWVDDSGVVVYVPKLG
ncbi:hypothetical protein CRG98_047430 [Punica granatum]|uniref:Inhibitor of trypsin and hageman factor-like n=1 Tax=Punica granatum TaxID=22663 RepID=A0A2I0HKB8_PUNGR|nr:hypothetical protein CRG98_047430 [Punica granatum]